MCGGGRGDGKGAQTFISMLRNITRIIPFFSWGQFMGRWGGGIMLNTPVTGDGEPAPLSLTQDFDFTN